MEGILFDILVFQSPISVIAGLALLATAVGTILLVRMSDEERKGDVVFWAESPFTGVHETPAAEERKILRAA